MNRVIEPPADKAGHARRLCEQAGWLDVVGFSLDWQLESPEDPGAYFYRGIALAALGRLGEAETCYRRALQLDPADFKVWNNLATLLFELLDRPAEGAACLAQAIQLAPENQLAWANLASMHGQLSRHDEALAYAERALAIDPEMVEAHLHRARAAQALGRMEIVRETSEALSCLPPEKFQRAR